jgi:tRNA-dihydrouridine synthase A
MRAVVRVPVTVKMRIGVVSASARDARTAVAGFDEADFEKLCGFISSVRDAGCAVAIVHARKAVLGGFSPKDNREIPPLRYDVVQRVRAHFPDLPMVVNGGVRTAAAALESLSWSDGVMLGREAYHRPFVLSELHRRLDPQAGPAPAREALLERMQTYAARELARGGRLAPIVRHMLGSPNPERGGPACGRGRRPVPAGDPLVAPAPRFVAARGGLRIIGRATWARTSNSLFSSRTS